MDYEQQTLAEMKGKVPEVGTSLCSEAGYRQTSPIFDQIR